MLVLPNKDKNKIEGLSVNGELLTAYSVPHGQNITVTGTVKDLLNALNAEFYASHWKGQQAAMTVNLIDIEMPLYDNGKVSTYVQIAYYEPFLNQMKETVRGVVNNMDGLLGFFLKKRYDKLWSPGINLSDYGLGDDVCIKTILQNMLKDGIPRDNSNGDMIYLTRFIAAETLTFEQIVENGASNASSPILLLDETQVHKEVGAKQINSLFDKKFTGAKFEELKRAVDTGECNNTITIIYDKIEEKVGDKKVDIKIDEIEIWPIFQAIFSSPEQMAAILGDVRVKVEIGTCSPTGTSTTHPIVIWGLNAGIKN